LLRRIGHLNDETLSCEGTLPVRPDGPPMKHRPLRRQLARLEKPRSSKRFAALGRGKVRCALDAVPGGVVDPDLATTGLTLLALQGEGADVDRAGDFPQRSLADGP